MRPASVKVWVWKKVLCDSGCGMVVVIAENRRKALSLLKKSDKHAWEALTSGEDSEIEPTIAEGPAVFVVYGAK